MNSSLMWSPYDEPGLEHLRLIQDSNQIVADGMILRVINNEPFRVHYEIRCDASWNVRKVEVNLLNEPRHSLQLNADGRGHWTDDSGNPIGSLDGCFEVDILVTPFTNTLVIRRTQLKPGESADIVAAYMTILELEVKPSRQRYTCLEFGLYRFEEEGLFRGFRVDLPVDGQGLVLDYPNLFRRVWTGE